MRAMHDSPACTALATTTKGWVHRAFHVVSAEIWAVTKALMHPRLCQQLSLSLSGIEAKMETRSVATGPRGAVKSGQTPSLVPGPHVLAQQSLATGWGGCGCCARCAAVTGDRPIPARCHAFVICQAVPAHSSASLASSFPDPNTWSDHVCDASTSGRGVRGVRQVHMPHQQADLVDVAG